MTRSEHAPSSTGGERGTGGKEERWKEGIGERSNREKRDDRGEEAMSKYARGWEEALECG